MLALKGMGTMGQVALAAIAVPSVLLISAVALIFTLVCAAPLRLLQTR
jgi:hypothetical protein